MFSETSLFTWFAAVTCCCNHLTNFKFSGSNWKSNCTSGTFSKIYLCNRFAAVTCCSNQVTDYSTFQGPRESPMPQQVPVAKLVSLTASLLQPVDLFTLLATQHFRIQVKLQCHNRYLFAKLVCLTALLLQPVALITLLATQIFRIQEKLQCPNAYRWQNLFV